MQNDSSKLASFGFARRRDARFFFCCPSRTGNSGEFAASNIAIYKNIYCCILYLQYLCYLETCKTKFLNPTLRMQHCIDEHKFPPNFRFDYKIVQNKNIKPHSKSGSHIDDFDGTTMDTTSSGETSKKSNTTSFIQPKQFTFRPSRPKTFQENRSYTGKKFTSDKVQATTSQSTFDDENMLVELKECLPD